MSEDKAKKQSTHHAFSGELSVLFRRGWRVFHRGLGYAKVASFIALCTERERRCDRKGLILGVTESMMSWTGPSGVTVAASYTSCARVALHTIPSHKTHTVE